MVQEKIQKLSTSPIARNIFDQAQPTEAMPKFDPPRSTEPQTIRFYRAVVSKASDTDERADSDKDGVVDDSDYSKGVTNKGSYIVINDEGDSAADGYDA